MGTVVLDATAAIGALVGDNAEAVSDGAILPAGRLLVPAHWHRDVASILREAERQGQLASGCALEGAAALAALGVVTDQEPGAGAWERMLDLACRHGLHLFEAGYLELAVRGGHTLATLDPRLAEAAEKEGVVTVP